MRYSMKTGWCRSHHVSWFRYGDPLAGLAARFWAKVDKSAGLNGCWPWISSSHIGDGYGAITIDGHTCYAHRVAYELATGESPGKLWVDHTCFNHACQNPAHLRLATPKQNIENQQGLRPDNTSGARGVYRDRRRNKWIARVQHNGKLIYVGQFATPELAGEEARLKRLELFTHNVIDRS